MEIREEIIEQNKRTTDAVEAFVYLWTRIKKNMPILEKEE